VAEGNRTLRISFESPEQFRREYESNLFNGGVFIPSDEAFELRETVRIELQLCYEHRAIGLEAEVVHTVTPEMAQVGGVPGVAVHFKGNVADVRATLERLVGESLPAPEPPPAPRPEAEARAAPRTPVRVAARIDDGEDVLDVRTRNLSKGGVLVDVGERSVPVGETIELTLRHPTTDEEIAVPGRVAREVETDGRVSALAIQFAPDEEERERVEDFVDEIQRTEHSRRLGGITGAIEELGPQNLVQMFSMSAPTGTLYLRREQQEGMIGFEGGLMRYALLGASKGMDALKRMLTWRDGAFEFHARLEEVDVKEPPLPLEAALLEAVRQLDEEGHAESRHFPLHAHFEVNEGADRCGSQLTKLEAAILDLARAGFTLQRMLDVIPESDPEILRAIESLADDELLTQLG
jgi:Tfp pilus assembly protein PilZ